MKYNLIIITILLTLNSCQQQSVKDAIIEFKTSPSWHEDLTVQLNTKSQELTFIKPNTWMYRKTGEKQKVFYELDSITQAIAKKYGRIDFRITKKLSDNDFQKLYNAFQYLIKNHKEDKGLGLDGMTYYITSTTADTIIKVDYHMPEPNEKKVKTIFNIIKNTFEENIVVQLTLENVERYTPSSKDYKIVSRNPLYVRMLENFNHRNTERIIDELPASDSIYVDLINYEGQNDSILIDAFHKKYPKVEWIVPPRIWWIGKFLHEYKGEVHYQDIFH